MSDINDQGPQNLAQAEAEALRALLAERGFVLAAQRKELAS